MTMFMWSFHRITILCLFFLISAAGVRAQTVTWTNALGGAWSDSANWIDDEGVQRVPGQSDHVIISENAGFGANYEIILDHEAAINSLTFDAIRATLVLEHDLTAAGTVSLLHQGSEISGSGDLTVEGLFSWRGGRLSGSGTTLAAGGLELIGDAVSSTYTKVLDERTLVLPSGQSGIHEGRYFSGRNGATLIIEEGAEMSLTTVAGMAFQVETGSETSPLIINHGILHKAGGASQMDVYWDIENHGTIHVADGTLRLRGRLPVADGTFSAASEAVLAFYSIGPVVFSESSNLTIDGTVHFFHNDAYEIRGTVDVGGTFRLTSSGTSAQAEVTIVPTANLVNLGRWLRLGSDIGNDSGGRLIYQHSKPIQVDTLTLRNNGGIFTDVPITVNNHFVLGDRSAIIETPSQIDILAKARWIGGTLKGDADIVFHQGVDLEGNSGSASWSKLVDDRRIIIPSGQAFRLLGTRTIEGTGSARIVIEEGAEMDFTVPVSLSGSGNIVNHGTIRTSGAGSQSRISWSIDNHGSILADDRAFSLEGQIRDYGGHYEVSSGSELQFNAIGEVVFAESSTITGAGTIHFRYATMAEINGLYDIAGITRLSSTSTRTVEVVFTELAEIQNIGRWLRIGGGDRNSATSGAGGLVHFHEPATYVIDSLTIGGLGILRGPVDFSVNDWFVLANRTSFYETDGDLHVLGEGIWNGGTFRGDGVVRVDGHLTILGNRGSGSWDKELDGRQMFVGDDATLTLAGTRAFTGSNDAELIIEEGGTFDILSAGDGELDMIVERGATNLPSLINRGTIRSSDTQSATLRLHWDFVNEGVVEIGPFVPDFRRGLLNKAQVVGSGVVKGELINEGTIRPGPVEGGSGIIEVHGRLTQMEDGIIDLDIAGISPGESYDQLHITEFELGGTLRVSLTDGYTLSTDDIYQIILFDERHGSFDNIQTHPEGAGIAMRITDTAMQVYAAGLPEPPSRPSLSVKVDSPPFWRFRDIPVHATISSDGGAGIAPARTKEFIVSAAPILPCPMNDPYENLRCRLERFGVTPPEADPDSEEQYPFLNQVPFPGKLAGEDPGGGGSIGSEFTAVFSEGGSMEISGTAVCTIGEEIRPEVEVGRAVSDDDLWGCAYEIGKLALDFVPGYECFKLGAGITSHIGEGFYNGQFDLTGYLAANMVGALNCAGDAVPATKAIRIMMKLNDIAGKAGGIKGVATACGNAVDSFSATARGSGSTRCIASADPNDKVGPPGAGDGRWVTTDDTLSYVVFFENKPEATAAAQYVIIKDTVDVSVVDFETFSFGMIAWADTSISMPEGEFAVTRDVDLRPKHDLILRITAELEEATGILTWRFDSLDPETLELTQDPLAGFLPPNKESPEGEGMVSYMFRPVAELPTGTRFGHAARIYFDDNDPIDTPVWSNGIDMAAPTSYVDNLAAVQTSTDFTVRWVGEDAESGVSSYDVYVSENDGAFTLWLEATTDTSAVFSGLNGSSYGFYSIATDSVGHFEEKEAVVEASTRVDVPTSASDGSGLPREHSLDAPYPNPASDHLTIRYALPQTEHVRIGIYDMLGRKVATLLDDIQPAGRHPLDIDTRHLAPGTYVLRMTAGEFQALKTMVIVR